ncbi:hypothetical protein Sjap_012526 [Stephania japonica]|uniref:Probable purine permease n=1 Tax=Stephania japonica TaxID=461633 RepID=A0AAP0IW92_9MAGN
MSTVNIEGGSSALSNGTTDHERSSTDTSVIQLKLMNLKSLIVKHWILLISAVIGGIGSIGSPILFRLYYIHGGNRKWIPGWLQSSGFPILLIPISINYLRHSRDPSSSCEKFFISPKVSLCASALGLLYGLDNFTYTFGLSYLPVSTSSIVYSSDLVFIAFFSYFIVRQRFTPYSINAVVLITLGSVLLGIRQNGDRPTGVSAGQYLLGFLMTICSAALLGVIIPSTEVSFTKVAKNITYNGVLQFQFFISLFSTIFCTVGMIVNKDFPAMPREAREYGLGESWYYVVLVLTAVICQLAFLGGVGVIFSSSALASAVFSATLLPMSSVAGAIVYREKFSGEKGISLALCLWGRARNFILMRTLRAGDAHVSVGRSTAVAMWRKRIGETA